MKYFFHEIRQFAGDSFLWLAIKTLPRDEEWVSLCRAVIDYWREQLVKNL
jgi:hypothetical protein